MELPDEHGDLVHRRRRRSRAPAPEASPAHALPQPPHRGSRAVPAVAPVTPRSSTRARRPSQMNRSAEPSRRARRPTVRRPRRQRRPRGQRRRPRPRPGCSAAAYTRRPPRSLTSGRRSPAAGPSAAVRRLGDPPPSRCARRSGRPQGPGQPAATATPPGAAAALAAARLRRRSTPGAGNAARQPRYLDARPSPRTASTSWR